MIARAAIAAAAVVAIAGTAVGTTLVLDESPAPSSSALVAVPTGCNDWPGVFTGKECGAAGIILTSLSNLQPAAQFCKWKAANPGEWNRLSGYASTGVMAASIITWLGGSILNELQAYFITGAPTFSLPRVPLPPNACGGKLIAPPTIQGVTPGQTDVTVTVGP